jgi:hypothetical protein
MFEWPGTLLDHLKWQKNIKSDTNRHTIRYILEVCEKALDVAADPCVTR